MKKRISKKIALGGLILTSCTLSAMEATQAETHCKGVATKWVNDCKANGHGCSMHAEANFDANEWLKLSSKDCKQVQEAIKNPVVKRYIERIQKGTVTAVKRGKKF